MLGSGSLGADAYLSLRRVHPTLNVLGFASLTIVGTLVTLLPTILRVRMVAWRGGLAVALLATGVALQAAGWVATARWVAATGGVAQAAGAIVLCVHVALTVRTPRRFAVPTAAMHLLAGIAWFVGGSIWLAVQLARRSGRGGSRRSTFLAVFVCGWLIQVLLGAWAYLLPMARPGGPQEHRAALQVFEVLGRTEVVAFNAGVVLLVAGHGLMPGGVTTAGWCLALTAIVWALCKTWGFPVLAGRLSAGARGTAVWAA